jgi:MFS-type transporter involved in bile tolerance (Atg22 family)
LGNFSFRDDNHGGGPPDFLQQGRRGQFAAEYRVGPNIASAYWGYTVAIAMITGAILAPILGAIADHTGAAMP